MNRAREQRGVDVHAKLIHVSGFMNFLDPAIQDIVAPADIIMFQRNLVAPAVVDVVNYWQGYGKPVIADLDDAYHILPPANVASAFWVNNSAKLDPPPLEMLERGLTACNALTAPNRLLLQDWKHVVKGYFVPNFARAEWWLPTIDRDGIRASRGLTNRIVIGWGGSVSHYDSWWGSGIREAAERICRRHPEVLWLICGNDARIWDQLPVSATQKALQPGVPPDQWPGIVKLFDIGVAPLFGPYDQRRSWIKGMEYLLAGVPWVGTAGEPYGDLESLGTLVHNHINAWEDALENKINRLTAERELANARVPQAQRAFLLENNLHVYEQAYTEIIAAHGMERGRLPNIYHVQKEIQKEATA